MCVIAIAQQCSQECRKLRIKALKLAINKHLQATSVDFVKCRWTLHFSCHNFTESPLQQLVSTKREQYLLYGFEDELNGTIVNWVGGVA